MKPRRSLARVENWLAKRSSRDRDHSKHSLTTRSDQGFTLIELLITATILPLVIGAISVGLIAVLSLQSSVGNRLSNSGDAQVISANYLKDVQSSAMITTQSSSTPQCGSGSQLLGLQWDNGQTVVSYVSLQIPNGSSFTYSLVRYLCTFGNTLTPANTTTVSYGLSSSQGPPSITCSTTVSSCAYSTKWISTAGISAVTFAIMEPSSNFSFTLTATPRAWNASSGGVTGGGVPYAPLTLLDPNSCQALQIGNNGTLSENVGTGTGNGILNISSTCPNTVRVSNNATLAASSVITSDPSLDSIRPNNNDRVHYPSTEYYSAQFANPFASLTTPAIPTGPTVTCSIQQGNGRQGNGQNTSYTCPPGPYSSSPTFNDNSNITINFSGTGTYYFQRGLSIPSNATVNFSSGTYIFDGGTALSTGNGVTLNGNNVLFYIGSGSTTIGNNASISLSSLSGYDGIAIWDAVPVPSGTFTIKNSSNVNVGGIYIPNSSLITASNVTISATFIVVGTADFGNNLNLTISSP